MPGIACRKLWYSLLLIMIKRPFADKAACLPPCERKNDQRREANWQEDRKPEFADGALPRIYCCQDYVICKDKERRPRNVHESRKLTRTDEEFSTRTKDIRNTTFREEPPIAEEDDDMTNKTDQRRMELHDLHICYGTSKNQSSNDCLQEKLKGNFESLGIQEPWQEEAWLDMPTIPKEEDKNFYMESKTARQLVERYFKALKELDLQRKANLELSQDRAELENELKLLRNEITSCKTAVESETASRERIQQDLRRLADSLERDSVKLLPCSTRVTRDATSVSDVEDIEYYKDQFRIYQDDFKEEKQEKERLRVLNLRLTNELEEAKREIESHQKKLLVYAQLFSNGAPAQVVIPPAYIGRRVHSNPTTPSFSQGHPTILGRNPYQGNGQQENLHRRAVGYDQYLDVIPKGSCEVQQTKFSFDEGPFRPESSQAMKDVRLERHRSCSIQN